MTGVGYVAMDIALFMASILAALVNLFYLRSSMGYSKGIAFMRLLRCTGWVLFSSRLGAVLFTTGDVLISVPGAIAIFFLAAGEIVALFNRGQKVLL